ncbi:MAG: zinc-ribbon domain-containing protein [Caldilineaceae bacterium]|nr:zinc-ribbon domain-containing protein [Caldilineaceae bacterium]
MIWISLLLAFLLAGGALAFIVWPLVSREAPLLPMEDDRLADLLARKDRALRSIKELEFDHQVGKIDDENYQRLNYRLSQQAIALIKQVEKITPATAELDEALEAEIAKLRRVQATSRATDLSATIATGEAVRSGAATAATNGKRAQPATQTAPPSRFCTACGTKLEPSYKFCAGCGAPVAQTAVAQED